MSGSPCRRSACEGVLEDGYCNVCGHAESRTSKHALNGGSSASNSLREMPQRASVEGGLRLAEASQDDGQRWRVGAKAGRDSRRQLGAGLVLLPELPSVEPERALLLDPVVPERKRFCAKCDASLRRETGFCGKCGTRYSFVPTLHAGDVVADQYDVKGPIAFGGLGWIYLAFDTLLSRYVVLKGLLNAQDTAAAAAAVAERRFLAAVKHPNIVSIYNFVQAGGEGFIVMEYVGGKTLKQIRQERGPLPPSEAIAYLLRILPAFGYLHRQGLVFCDFKPDNIMLEHDDVKLIDLGGVRSVHDATGDVYGTVGYSAPEAGVEPTPASDLFTVGRTLAVLLTDISGFGREHQFTLPAPDEKPLFAEQESLYAFLLKATAQEASARFSCAEEMAEQLLGILREVVARHTGVPRPGVSQEFGADLLRFDAGDPMATVVPDARCLPLPRSLVDEMEGTLAMPVARTPEAAQMAALRLVCQQRPQSREHRLHLAALLSDAGEYGEAEHVLHQLGRKPARDWRLLWIRGRHHLRRAEPAVARDLFQQVYCELPGELAPKLALGLAAELQGELAPAARMYELVIAVDPGFHSAVFGLARCQHRAGHCQAAVSTLARIPASSALYARAQVESMRLLLDAGSSKPHLEEVLAAARKAEGLPLDEKERCRLHADLFRAALAGLGPNGTSPGGKATLLGKPVTERSVRLGLEGALRSLARFAEKRERLALIEEANQIRPRTWI